MTWTVEEWDRFAILVEEGWPGEFSDAASLAWRAMLDDVEPQAAVRTLKELLLRGSRFRPSLSEFLAAVRFDPSMPTFEEAYSLIYRALRDEPARTDNRLVAAFIMRFGEQRLRMLPVDDPTWGEKHRRDLREAWERHVDAWDGRERAAVAAGGEPRQLDPLASLRLLPGGAA